MLQNVTEKLKPGAHFIGTTGDANVLVKKLKNLSKNNVFGNEYYSVKFY